jgi:uncharacterized protein with PIN domain
MFWDSSALVPLLIPEPRSLELAELLAVDREPVMWWASPVECQSALHRRRREGVIPRGQLDEALSRLDAIVEDYDVISASDDLRRRAGRAVAVHPLRATDALQLAALLLWGEGDPGGERFVCLDERLREAARQEGFTLRPE